MTLPTIIIVTGLSGSGKSTALNALEDAGYYCIDNLPSSMLGTLIEHLTRTPSLKKQRRFAINMDARERDFARNFNHYYSFLKNLRSRVKILFLEAEPKILIQRFSTTRRRHPLLISGSLEQAIQEETRLLSPVCDKADKIIDTSDLNVHQLKRRVLKFAQSGFLKKGLSLTLLSFGYGHGVPHHADLVIDVRFIPNPYFVPRLKNLTGKHAAVKRYILKHKAARMFLKKLTSFLDFLIRQYENEGKVYLTIALGCTGGRHRSVALTGLLARHLKKKGYETQLMHRDLP